MSLVVSNLSVDHGAIRAVSGVSFTVESGKIAAIIGSKGQTDEKRANKFIHN